MIPQGNESYDKANKKLLLNNIKAIVIVYMQNLGTSAHNNNYLWWQMNNYYIGV